MTKIVRITYFRIVNKVLGSLQMFKSQISIIGQNNGNTKKLTH